MRKAFKPLTIIGLLAALGFILGAGRLFLLRFEAGDVYPVYSSLRADPLGLKAFYESLRDTGRFAVERNYGPLVRIPAQGGFTLFCLGTSSFALQSPDLVDSLHTLVLNGARLVLSIGPDRTDFEAAPERGSPVNEREAEGPEDPATPSLKKDADAKVPGEGCGDASATLRLKWEAAVACDRQPESSGSAYLNPGGAAAGLPPVIPWHSACYFDDLSPAWRVIYQSGRRPLVIERSLGRGKLILMTDTFLLSNEALRDERHPRLLAWLSGPHPQVVFEETHLGLSEKPGVAELARRTRLHWPLAALILLALLFVWKNAVPFVPPPEEDDPSRAGRLASEKDYTEGLISLLHRSIPKTRVLETMVAQWQKDLPRNRPLSAGRLRRIRAALAGDGRSARPAGDPLRLYHTLYELISEKSDE